MLRLLFFTITMGYVSAFFMVLSYLENTIMTWPIFVAWTRNPQSSAAKIVIQAWQSHWIGGLLLGIFMGVGLATWDRFRRRPPESSWMLHKNFFWCGIYILPFKIVNGIFFVLASLYFAAGPTLPSWLSWLSLASVVLLNFMAVLWAIIRYVSAGSVLTPRVLRNKLRERSRLS